MRAISSGSRERAEMLKFLTHTHHVELYQSTHTDKVVGPGSPTHARLHAPHITIPTHTSTFSSTHHLTSRANTHLSRLAKSQKTHQARPLKYPNPPPPSSLVVMKNSLYLHANVQPANRRRAVKAHTTDRRRTIDHILALVAPWDRQRV